MTEAKFAIGDCVEVVDKLLPEFQRKGEVIAFASVLAAVSAPRDRHMYTIRDPDGRVFRASESQIKEVTEGTK